MYPAVKRRSHRCIQVWTGVSRRPQRCMEAWRMFQAEKWPFVIETVCVCFVCHLGTPFINFRWAHTWIWHNMTRCHIGYAHRLQNMRTHLLYDTSKTPFPSLTLISLSLSRVSWPTALAASWRALLMMVLKKSGKWQRKRGEKRMWQTAFCSPTPTDPELWQKKKETGRDSLLLESSLCLFLAAAPLPSVDQTSGVEG